MIASIGTGIPPNERTQPEVKSLVREIFKQHDSKLIQRLQPVFDHAQIDKRQFAVETKWFKEAHTFQEKNSLYHELAIKHSLEAVDSCLSNRKFLKEPIPFEAVDMIIFVSSTGIATPSLDTYMMAKRPFREDTSRMPLWGLGCAGGAIGLSRAFDWIRAHPEKNVLLVCCELCSLTFQKDDYNKSNIVGTALFGDGAGAALVMGNKSPYLPYSKQSKPRIIETSSATKKNSHSVMGWDITNRGLEVVFSKSIPALVRSFWSKHISLFLNNVNIDHVHSYIAHPGGRKVLEAMTEILQIPQEKIKHSCNVLRDHGNMSSATILYVLNEWMQEGIAPGSKSVLSALGPGFSSELLLLEWHES
ncbi:type III polyketide synthase [Lentibacillus jeotgali]|uniref:type III polyketide synthase n=1 Tax=Lentibacillus jeotgali TaxID=558169 RepID=UPI0002628BEB|nr:3-oxoacyl-[acyl-carrier-protein] synthase III C-terminal domain-containing protein [Lentibacillus jeotgali]